MSVDPVPIPLSLGIPAATVRPGQSVETSVSGIASRLGVDPSEITLYRLVPLPPGQTRLTADPHVAVVTGTQLNLQFLQFLANQNRSLLTNLRESMSALRAAQNQLDQERSYFRSAQEQLTATERASYVQLVDAQDRASRLESELRAARAKLDRSESLRRSGHHAVLQLRRQLQALSAELVTPLKAGMTSSLPLTPEASARALAQLVDPALSSLLRMSESPRQNPCAHPDETMSSGPSPAPTDRRVQ
jgi:hypothetical protein